MRIHWRKNAQVVVVILFAWGFAPGAPAAPHDSVLPAVAAAADADGGGQVNEVPEDGLGRTLLKMAVVLGLVVGLVYLTLNFGLRRLMGVRAGTPNFGALVQVVQRIPLDPKRSLYVVKMGKEYLLLGAGEMGLSLLGKLDAEEAERIEREGGAGRGPPPFLVKLLSRRGVPPPPSA